MHQDHNLHWDTVAANLVFVSEKPDITPRCTDLFPQNLATQTKSLHYFIRALVSTIRSFSETERAKYAKQFSRPNSGKVFPDELLDDSSSTPLSIKNQDMKYWIESAECQNGHYNTSNGDLADATKALIAANAMEPLLMLAQHPKVPLGILRSLSWGHSFGFNYVASTALNSYIFFNVLAATPYASKCLDLRSYRYVLCCTTDRGDYDAHTIPHRAFFGRGDPSRVRVAGEFDPMADYSALREYLKMCFERLYRYDMLVRECGLDAKWEREIVFFLNGIWNFNLEDVDVENS